VGPLQPGPGEPRPLAAGMAEPGVAGEARLPGRGPGATESDRLWLREAVALSRQCPPSQTAFAVGAVLVAADGSVLATGYSRELGPHDHAEETALVRLRGRTTELAAASLYSSLEPCRYRASRPRPCAELIIEAGVGRVVVAWLEPPVFAAGGGAELLRGAGVVVVEIPELAAGARAVNAHVLRD
jgi:diaminohydroxyphosphoribosylaminopyrimidine deaminase / 5-amino-6-(5-phosphoribosylamino)uracil reductase